jgi:hypothetical protein
MVLDADNGKLTGVDNVRGEDPSFLQACQGPAGAIVLQRLQALHDLQA